jgi:hypothetical protein
VTNENFRTFNLGVPPASPVSRGEVRAAHV